jgi:hypothetical protein
MSCDADAIRDTIPTIHFRNEGVIIVRSRVTRGKSVSVATTHTVTDGIKDHKLVLVARNQADRQTATVDNPTRYETASKSDTATTAPVVRLCSDQTVSYVYVAIVRDIEPIVDAGARTATRPSKHSRTTSRHSPLLLLAPGSPFTEMLNSPAPYWQQIPSLYVSAILKVYSTLYRRWTQYWTQCFPRFSPFSTGKSSYLTSVSTQSWRKCHTRC